MQEVFTGWRAVLATQDWALAPVFIIGCIAILVGNHKLPQEYREERAPQEYRNVILTDASISYKHLEDSIPVST